MGKAVTETTPTGTRVRSVFDGSEGTILSNLPPVTVDAVRVPGSIRVLTDHGTDTLATYAQWAVSDR